MQNKIYFTEIRKCIGQIGNQGFFNLFFALLHEKLQIDQCMIFHYGNHSVDCLLSRNFGSVTKGHSIAQKYLSHGFERDPLLKEMNNLKASEDIVFWGQECSDRMDEDYRRTYFEDVGVSEKVAVLNRTSGKRFCVNFYRKLNRPKFENSDQIPKSIWSILAQICLTHLLCDTDNYEIGPLSILSEKERQVCSGILKGKKTEQIAADYDIAVSTAITYKRRAYQKLGISSRSALFDICGMS